MINKNAKRITQAELARLLDVSRAAVNKAVKSGRIVPGDDGLFDSVCAVEDWKNNTRTAIKAASLPEKAKKKERGGQPKYASARARRELAQARMAELKEARLRGMYCLTSEVEHAVASVVTDFRLRLEGVPNRIASELAHKDADRIRATLKQEIRAALTQIYDDMDKMTKEVSTPDESEYPSIRM